MRDAAASMKAARRLEAEQRKAQEMYLARLEVEEFESTIAALTSVHRECSAPIHWPTLLTPQATIDQSESRHLEAQLASYRPSFWERLWGSKKRRDDLLAALDTARAREREAWERANADASEVARVASLVLSGNTDAYNHVIESTGCLEELREFGCEPRGTWVDAQTAFVTIRVPGPEVVPSESKSLTASGRLSTKRVPANTHAEMYQDFVCGVALRTARELCSVLPLHGVFCDVRAPVFDSRSGQSPEILVLSVHCHAERLTSARVNFDRVDPSDLVTTFPHAMKLARGKGFQAVETIAPVRSVSSHHG